MKIIITGGAGFIGSQLALALLENDYGINFERLVLTDIQCPTPAINDPRVQCLALDLTQPGAAEKLIDTESDVLFHLAAIVSSHAEQDFDSGMSANFDVTRRLLEAARAQNPSLKFIFTSSLAVFGGELPEIVTEHCATHPQSSYGTQKAMCELMINDYSRKGYVDGRILRLPTISVRPGKPNKAASSFVSGMIREPLHGEKSVCPVSRDLLLWLSSPETVIRNLIHAMQISGEQFVFSRIVNLPGISVTVQEMLNALKEVAGQEVMDLIHFEPDENINRIVSSWPGNFDIRHSLALGFSVDSTFSDIIRNFMFNDKF
ncbi:D-erythronate dehydrogenase [Xenorhabdus szentirmaii]|uniref:NAD-dependent epimerase/dehydratase domain-containing protein n=2 Tax=Xenorhabdus szentirmaii TaxID=290112 RepID=W1IV05_9GAMM|nr:MULTISPECIES: D-erythronate dehydrogenase [Xenorhabdus]MBD2781990.1 SDR family oxidoreductase [Xenorhabdus sp. 38]MBD2791130.1 SDR family oxidoreductase [Xenorhabdus sp. CUL]MBD2799600.1 SDR family oxidoreductase [Xenorhabdus sp. M]MBD2805634.1 SDR family oxidoreductase [Xenorhabdus sp. ZM]MBD2821035.1 SDR family oxidoreductase [Xenorhabdus sp. 42]